MKRMFGYFSLESGAVFTGYSGLVGLVLFLGFAIKESIADYHRSVKYEYDFNYLYTFEFKIVIFLIFGMISSILLIYGSKTKRRFFLVPWLVLFGIFVPFGIVLSIFYVHAERTYLYPLIALVFLATWLLLGILIYSWFGVHSLYQNLAQIDKDMKEKNIQYIARDGETPYVDIA